MDTEKIRKLKRSIKRIRNTEDNDKKYKNMIQSQHSIIQSQESIH